MALEPSYFANKVDSAGTFLEFVAALREHREEAVRATAGKRPALSYDVGPGGWENWTIEEFLEAMEAYAVDAQLPEQPTWQLLARLLLPGKGYE